MTYSQFQASQYNLIFENCMESVIIFDEFGRIQDFNRVAKEETGYQGELLGQMITEIYPDIHLDGNKRVKFGPLEHGDGFDMVAYRRNKTCFPVKARVISMQQGNRIQGICIAANESERNEALRSHKGAMEEVEEATKMKNEFMANITHELRTPINGMKGMAESLLDTQLTPSQAETVNIISKCCDNMTKIINDLLDFSKIEAGKLTIENREFNFRSFLDEVLALNVIRINEKGLKLIVNISSNIPDFVVGDELRLGQIINNLFSNAVKFTSEGHIGLEIDSTVVGGKVELFFMIIDTGIGIAKEEQDKLFRSFSQVDGSITRRFGGTGLGLAICKQLVELMGGNIRLVSEKGKGSTFSFSVKFGIANSRPSRGGRNYPAGRFVYNKVEHSTVQKEQEKPEESEKDYQFTPIDIYEMEDTIDKVLKQLHENIEKLSICMSLETWEKAESFAGAIKNLVPKEEKEIKRITFQLLLAVRKEDLQKAESCLDKLERLLPEEED